MLCVRLATLLTVLVAAAAPAVATVLDPGPPAVADTSKYPLIRRLLKLTGAADVAVAAIESSIPAQRAATPQIPGEFWDEFAIRVRRELPGLIALMVPIYDRHFSRAQIEQLIAFYESPLGRHLTKKQPTIAVESMQAGQQWGAALGSAVAQDLQKRGVRMP